MFRAMQGIALALSVPASISVITKSVESGRPRNLGIAFFSLAMPLGFSFGLVLGGVFVNTIGWRAGYYLGSSMCLLSFLVGMWALPKDPRNRQSTPNRLAKEVDWVGAVIASTSLALLSYVLA